MRKLLFLLVLALSPVLSLASIDGQAGPYRISLTTQPKVIPVGKANMVMSITDAAGKALEGLEVRVIARMPGMFMGEREQQAFGVPGEGGSYSAQASFPMNGAYEVALTIKGALGEASTVLPASTGQDTSVGSRTGFAIERVFYWILALALVVFVLTRMRRTGQGLHLKGLLTRGTIGGIALLVVMYFVASYAVRNWRRDGAMTPIEAQVMEMNTPAPPGATAVELGNVERGSIAETVRYSGQAVGFVEQDVNARGTGVIVSMPLYVGAKVRKGQVLARLDTSQLDPQLAEKAAMTNVAAQGVGVAAAEHQAALQEVSEARADVAVKESGVAEAEAMLEAAVQDKNATEAEVAAALGDVANAQAEVTTAEQTAKYRADELARMRELLAGGFVSRSAVQESESEAAAANAKVLQARSAVRQSESRVTAARANARKAEAMISAAQKRVRQAKSEVTAAKSAVLSRQKAADAAKQNVAKERAGVAQARAGYASAAAERGYAELKAETDGVITQRLISPGTLVNPGQTILKVAQISPIRLQANVASSDLARIGVGGKVYVTSGSLGTPLEARVSSISPSVDTQARTGVVEVILGNADGRIMPGQFVEMRLEVGAASDALSVPIEAVQRPPGSAKPFVWVADAGSGAGRYTVRKIEVGLGASDGKRIAVTGEVKEGQRVVTVGGAYLRDRGEVWADVAAPAAKGPVVEVSASGFSPDTVTVAVGEPVTITFIRRSEEGCGTEVVFPDLKIEKPLPLNKPVEVTFTPQKAGELKFACGMDMLRGKVVVR